jgi:hypothetical protein
LSDAEGMCHSDGECPYGCDAEVRAFSAQRTAEDHERLKIDKVFVLCRLLITTGWLRLSQPWGVPSLVEIHERGLAALQPHVTPWVQAEFDRHWPVFWAAVSEPLRRAGAVHWLETDLYKLYHAEQLAGPGN